MRLIDRLCVHRDALADNLECQSRLTSPNMHQDRRWKSEPWRKTCPVLGPVHEFALATVAFTHSPQNRSGGIIQHNTTSD